MDRYSYAPYARDWLVFQDRYVLSVEEDYIAVSNIAPHYRQIKESDVKRGPHLSIEAIGAHVLRSLVLRQPNVTLNLSGESVGSIRENQGYEAASNGSYGRSVTTVQIALQLSPQALLLRISGVAGPVKQEKPPLMNWTPTPPIGFSYEFDVPLAFVPEVLNMNEEQRWRLKQLEKKMAGQPE